MATIKQIEKLDMALEIQMITIEQYSKAMKDYKYCYELVGKCMSQASSELANHYTNEAKRELHHVARAMGTIDNYMDNLVCEGTVTYAEYDRYVEGEQLECMARH